jgi:hypothetical protein
MIDRFEKERERKREERGSERCADDSTPMPARGWRLEI